MAKDYIPSTDAGLLAWGANADTLITATPTAYNLTAAIATVFHTNFVAFQTALAAATNPPTRGGATILAKDVARDQFVAYARQVAALVQAGLTVTPSQKFDLGLTVRDPEPTSIGEPTTKPVANVEIIRNLQHVLRVRDEATPTSNARPYGVSAAEVWVKIGPDEPMSIDDCDFRGLATRVPHAVDFEPEDAGKTAWYIFRWVNPKGQPGPTSDQISAMIAA